MTNRGQETNMYEPASDLTELKQLCKAIQGELAYGASDKEAVSKLAQEVVYFGNRLVAWAGEAE